MPAGLRFLVDRFSVRHYLEAPTLGWNQFDLRVGIILLELGGQTGRPGLVASISAVLDGEVHVEKYMREGAQPSVRKEERTLIAAGFIRCRLPAFDTSAANEWRQYWTCLIFGGSRFGRNRTYWRLKRTASRVKCGGSLQLR